MPRIRWDVFERALEGSLVVGAYDGESGEQIGYARAVTDYATFAWLADVFVVEEARGRGVAKSMIRALHEHPEMQTIRRWALATRDAQRVYEGLGYEYVPGGRWMQWVRPPETWQEPE